MGKGCYDMAVNLKGVSVKMVHEVTGLHEGGGSCAVL